MPDKRPGRGWAPMELIETLGLINVYKFPLDNFHLQDNLHLKILLASHSCTNNITKVLYSFIRVQNTMIIYWQINNRGVFHINKTVINIMTMQS